MSSIGQWGARIIGAAMLGTTAGIHADLYNTGYKSLPKIGVMFLLLIIGASILCLAVLAAPKGVLPLVAAVGALTEAATAIGLLIFTHHTIFNFRESTQAPHYTMSLTVEAIGFVVLGGLAVTSFRHRSLSR